MKNINEIVQQALKDGYLTPAMEAEVGKICDSASELSVEEYMALDQLMGALLEGEVVSMPRKQFINVMEELVISVAISRVAEIEQTSDRALDIGDIAAYALNRLPPLYATTEEGANYQRQRAQRELQELIAQQIDAAIDRYLDRPESIGQLIGTSGDITSQISNLLQSYANKYEASNAHEIIRRLNSNLVNSD